MSQEQDQHEQEEEFFVDDDTRAKRDEAQQDHLVNALSNMTDRATQWATDRIVAAIKQAMYTCVGVVIISTLFGFFVLDHMVDRAVDLVTERVRILVVGDEDQNGVRSPGLADHAARKTAEQLLPKLEELLQPTQTQQVVPQNQPSSSTSDAAGLNEAEEQASPASTEPTPAPPPPPPAKRDWSKFRR